MGEITGFGRVVHHLRMCSSLGGFEVKNMSASAFSGLLVDLQHQS
jgi:hypothetical protein